MEDELGWVGEVGRSFVVGTSGNMVVSASQWW